MRIAALALWLPLVLWGQQDADRQIQAAGVCARCHVISVVEWGVSRHWKAATNCGACHGASQGHVIDERNNVKPERVPHAAAIAGLCVDCHKGGCPKSKHNASCETCHHVHALVNPEAKTQAPVPAPAPAAERRRDPAEGLPRQIAIDRLKLGLVLVPGGEVDLGSDTLPKARPVHTVPVAAFYLGTHEVTAAQWQAIMGGPSGPAPSLPAAGISWADAQSFLRKLNAVQPGGGFRLPTEAEWELAARAGETSGNAFNLPHARSVGEGTANPLGIFDLAGNVWEWCSSLDRPYPYDPADGREDGNAPGLRILRGGGYADPQEWVTPATRHADRTERRLPWYGFRVARSLPAH